MAVMSNVQILDRLNSWKDDLLELAIDPQQRLLWVDIAGQRLYVVDNGRITQSYAVSTALKGPGCDQDSYQTPTGLHRISDKIGDDAATGTVFEGREPTGELAEVEQTDHDTGKDQITSRILWLSGMQPGINQGEGVDTYQRYIYIHGTNEEGRIGQAVSHGCIRMKNADVIALFQQVETDTPVIVE
jgi:lipoprotein-anchoring transpeptidase ErfK/SrfK